MSEQTQPAESGTAPLPGHETSSQHPEIEDYAGGYIQARHGRVDAWLLVVYAVLFVWAMYYLYVYWGGLGPGLGF